MDEHYKRYMRMALSLALKGAGRTSPNPLVGAVLVRAGRVIATGYHRRAGEDHAEIEALKRAGSGARGSTLYINLEPCDHQGRTPPCTLSLIHAGVRRVVAGMVDPNPLVAGKGIRRLRRAGVQVDIGLLEAECRRVNEAFIKYIIRCTPFVVLKLAASLDGKIATSTGDSRWITDQAARRYVHRLRDQMDAIMIGIGTVLADDPELTCRIRGGRNPLRIVLDPQLRIPLTARLLHGADPEKTIVVTGPRAPEKKVEAIQGYGATVWRLPLSAGRIPFGALLKKIGKMGSLSVMIEGGADTAGRALREKVVDKVLFFYAPKILGAEGREMIGALRIRKVSQCTKIRDVEVKKFGPDLLVSGYLK
ncbi:MAG: bifunctional diaminohydroxyphosphoribosylaminopyrimidine deaminase/5-amino-6-(5-phosphoribosylamino)uracil reductase RibD [Deltaproteobacteria bacterium]|nr:bifunctional diaminohydroxyphosphoribosylaminopyrimidine deaminase/5-amino-6-(5-phosphoribosylamino)uracil reductase RibD [Deltaproteobacteria bacterium]